MACFSYGAFRRCYTNIKSCTVSPNRSIRFNTEWPWKVTGLCQGHLEF